MLQHTRSTLSMRKREISETAGQRDEPWHKHLESLVYEFQSHSATPAWEMSAPPLPLQEIPIRIPHGLCEAQSVSHIYDQQATPSVATQRRLPIYESTY